MAHQCMNVVIVTFYCSFHVTNFSIEGFPFFLGIAIYCFEVKGGLPSWQHIIITEPHFFPKGAGLIMSLEASTAKEIRSSFRKYVVHLLAQHL